MPHYKSPDNKLHFLDDERFEYVLPEGSVRITDAEADEILAMDSAGTPDQKTRAQILALESQITPRRIREALLTEEGKEWLDEINEQITDLRNSLNG